MYLDCSFDIAKPLFDDRQLAAMQSNVCWLRRRFEFFC